MASKQLKIGAVLNFVALGLNAVIGLVYTPIMLRMLGHSEYGLYSLAASVIAYLSMLDLGFGNAVTRYTAKYRAEGKVSEQKEMFGMFTTLYTIIGIVAFIAGIVFILNAGRIFGDTLSPIELSRARTILLILTFNLAVTFPLSIFNSIIAAYEKFILLKSLQIIRILLNAVLTIGILFLGYKAIAVVAVQSALNIFILLLALYFCFGKLKIKINFAKFNLPLFKEIFTYSILVFLTIMMDKLYWSTGQFVLGATQGTVAVSIFAIAILLQTKYTSFSSGIATMLLPKTTTMVATSNDRNEISELFIKAGRIQYIIVAFLLSGFIAFGRQFICIWAGPGYEDAYIMALIFFIPLSIPLIQNLGPTILQARNQMKTYSIICVVIAAVCVALQIIFAKIWGGVGCSIAIALAITLGQILVMNFYYHKKQGLNIFKFWKEIAKMSVIPLILCPLSILITSYFPLNTIPRLLIGILAYTVVYVPLFCIFGLNKFEKDLILKPVLGKVLNKNF